MVHVLGLRKLWLVLAVVLIVAALTVPPQPVSVLLSGQHSQALVRPPRSLFLVAVLARCVALRVPLRPKAEIALHGVVAHNLVVTWLVPLPNSSLVFNARREGYDLTDL